VTKQTDSGDFDCASFSAPTEAHKKLKPFVGVFRAEAKLWMGSGEPHVSTGTMTNEWDLGGRYLKQTYVGDPSEGPFPEFQGRGYWGYNTVLDRYEGFWIDTASTFMAMETGQHDEATNVWTMTKTAVNPETGEPMQTRTVITLLDQDSHVTEMFFETPDGGELKGMAITYERVG